MKTESSTFEFQSFSTEIMNRVVSVLMERCVALAPSTHVDMY